MRKIALVIAALVIITILMQAADLNSRRSDAAAKLSGIAAELQALEVENAALEKDIFYYADPANLEKELRARFNYKSPGEELIIVVPRR